MNKAADFLVNRALNFEHSSVVNINALNKTNLSSLLTLRGFSEGGVRDQSSWSTKGKAACGWVIQGGFPFKTDGTFNWETLMYGQIFLGAGFNSFDAEMTGAEAVVYGTLLLLSLHDNFHCPVAEWFNTLLN